MSDITERQITSARVFNFPIEKVFASWSDPNIISQWWGPHGFTNTIRDFDFKPGGQWNFTMHGPDATDYENKIVFIDIKKNDRIHFDHISPPHFKVLATFDDLNGRTKVTFQMEFETPEICRSLKKICIDGNEQNFDRLTSILQSGIPDYIVNPELDLVLERFVDLPPNVMWKAWTQPQHIKEWFCPQPWTISHCDIDLRVGGLFNVTMRSPEGQDFPMSGCYLNIIENQKLVWTDALREHGRPSEKPFFTAIITFEPHNHGTKYKAVGLHRDIEGRIQHEKMGFHEGWNKCLDQLIKHMKAIDSK